MMKNRLYTSALMLGALALMTACSDENEPNIVNKQNPTTGMVTLTATVGSDTRTEVGDGYAVNWCAGDQIYVWGDNLYSTFDIVAPEGGTYGSTATFKGELAGDDSDTGDALTKLNYALYPKPTITTTTDEGNTTDSYSFKLPESYTYGTDKSNSPMYALFSSATTSEDGTKTLQFKHLCAMVRLTLSGITASEATLTLTANDEQNIAGTAAVTLPTTDGGEFSLAAPTGADATKSVSFKIQNSSSDNAANETTENTETTSSTDPMVFDIPIPAGTYTNGFTVSLTDANGTATIPAKAIGTTTLTAGQILVMDKLTVKEYSVNGEAPAFVMNVSNVAAANAALAADPTIKVIEIANYTDGETLYVPETYTGTLTVYLPTDTGTKTLNLTKGSYSDLNTQQSVARRSIQTRAETAETGLKLILHAPAGNKSKVSLSKIPTTEFIGAFAEAVIGADCSNVTVKTEAAVAKVSVASGTSASVKEVEDEDGNVVTVTTVKVGDATITITVPKTKAGEASESGEGSGTTEEETTIVTIGTGESETKISPKIELGDIMLQDGSIVKSSTFTADNSNPAIGVVAYLYSDAEKETTAKKLLENGSYFQAKGLVLALNDVENRYAWSNITEGTPTSTYYCETVVGKAVTESHDGYIYTQRIINRNDVNQFPAFDAINSFRSSNTITATDGSYLNWYMPSIGEWGDILKGLGGLETSTVKSKTGYEDVGYKYEGAEQYNAVANKIKGALTKAGATGELLTTTESTVKYYLSSTEISATDIWVMLFQKNNSNTFIYFYHDGKTAGGDYVRCILAF